MTPSPPIYQPSDARHFWLALGQHSPRLLRMDKSDRSRTAKPVRQNPLRLFHTHPPRQSDCGRRFDPTSPNQTPRLNPHRSRGTAGAPRPAISCLGAFQTPAAHVYRASSLPASENLHKAQKQK